MCAKKRSKTCAKGQRQRLTQLNPRLFHWPPSFAVAHRGASMKAPENTLAALRLAAQMGARAIESDIRLTADDEAVIFHDATLGRTTNGNGYLARKTLAQVRELDAGSWFSKKYAGEKIPTLNEWLQTAAAFDVSLNLELKVYSRRQAEVVAKKLTLALKKLPSDFIQKVIISSSNQYALQCIAQLDRSLPTALISDQVITKGRMNTLKQVGVRTLHQHVKVANKRYISRVHKEHMRFLAYTVNQKKQAKQLAEMNADGMFTDNHQLFKI